MPVKDKSNFLLNTVVFLSVGGLDDHKHYSSLIFNSIGGMIPESLQLAERKRGEEEKQ